MEKKGTKQASYRSLKEVYPVLREVSALRLMAVRVGLTPQGFRRKCIGSQFFTDKEKVQAVRALDELMNTLQEVREAIDSMPTRV